MPGDHPGGLQRRQQSRIEIHAWLPAADGIKTDKRSVSVRSRLQRCCRQGESSDPEQLSLARAAHDLDSLFSPVAWDRARHLGRIEASAHLSTFGAKRT